MNSQLRLVEFFADSYKFELISSLQHCTAPAHFFTDEFFDIEHVTGFALQTDPNKNIPLVDFTYDGLTRGAARGMEYVFVPYVNGNSVGVHNVQRVIKVRNLHIRNQNTVASTAWP